MFKAVTSSKNQAQCWLNIQIQFCKIKKMTCKEWLEFGIKVSGKIFDAAVIGFKWGKTF